MACFQSKMSGFVPTIPVPTEFQEPLRSASRIDRLPVLIFPTLQDDMDQRALRLGLMLTGASNKYSREDWEVYISSYTVAIFASVLNEISPKFIHPIGVHEREIRPQLDKLKVCIRVAKEKKADADLEIVNGLLSGFRLHPLLPRVKRFTGCGRVGLETWPQYLYCHYALVLYLAGNNTEEGDHTAVESLAARAKLPQPALVLSGPAKLSTVSRMAINEAWSDHSYLRSACLSEFCKFSASDVSIEQDLVSVIMHLLEYSGMKHAKIAMDFLQKYPWASEIPQLQFPICLQFQ